MPSGTWKTMRFNAVRMLAAVVIGNVLMSGAARAQAPVAGQPVVKIFPADEQTPHEQYRRAIVAPGVNEPEPYPGYTGFYGWQGIAKTRSGALILTFSSGYWHGSAPTPLRDSEKA